MKGRKRYPLLVVLALAAGAQHVFAQRLACSTIRPGETATSVAARITGDSRNLQEPWFQIVDPAASRFVAKARYDRVRAGWRACVVNEPVRKSPRAAYAGTAVVTRLAAAWDGIVGAIAGVDLLLAWWGALVVLIAIVLRSIGDYVTDRQTVVGTMTRFAETFVNEFERPLMQQHLPGRPVESRLRVSPYRARLDVLLAPNGGRRYPNLSDHKKNVEYDVTRVLQLLRDQPFVSGPLYAQGRWVVIPFQLKVSPQRAGAK